MKGISGMKMEGKMMRVKKYFYFVQNYVIMAFEKVCPFQILLWN